MKTSFKPVEQKKTEIKAKNGVISPKERTRSNNHQVGQHRQSFYFKTKDRFPYSYLHLSQAPPIGKYKPKHDVIDKKSKRAHVSKIPDKSEVRESIKPIPGCIVDSDNPCDRETRKDLFYLQHPEKKRPEAQKLLGAKVL